MKSQSSHSKTFILAAAGVAILAWAGITFLPTESVTAKVEKPQHSSGTVACGGFYTSNNRQKLRWVFINHNAVPIYIDGLRIYDWDGTKVWDSNDSQFGGTLPTDLNGLIGGTDNTLDGYQTAWYKSEQLVGNGILPSHTTAEQNQVKIHVDWHADSNVHKLSGALVRHVHLGDGTPWGRGQVHCSDL
jgi:hypothetical protein